MYPKQHLLYGAIFAGFLFFLFPQIGWLGFIIILASTVLIDADHYLYYVFKKKDLSLPNAYKWLVKKHKEFLSFSREKRNQQNTSGFLFHGVEALILLFILSFYLKLFLYIFAGFAFHIILDLADQAIHWDRLIKVSVIYDFINFNNQ